MKMHALSSGRLRMRKGVYLSDADRQAVEAAHRLTRLEGIIPALETAHAIAHLESLMPRTRVDDIVVICLSGRGDKDMDSYAAFADAARRKQ